MARTATQGESITTEPVDSAVDVDREEGLQFPAWLGPRRERWLTAIAVAAIAAATYGNTLSGGFVWDDVALVLNDSRLNSTESLPDMLSSDLFDVTGDGGGYGYYRPIVTLTYGADAWLWGRNPAGFHATNVILHALVSLLVLALGWRILRLRSAAALAAMLFAAHPIHTESVAWISGRTDLLATALVLAAWLLHLRGLESSDAVRRRLHVGLATATFLLALLAKEMAVVYPLLWFIGQAHGHGWRRAVRSTVPYFAAVGAYLLLRFGFFGVEAPPAAGQSMGVYLATAVTTLWRYIGMLVWPMPMSAYIQNPWIEAPNLATAVAAAASLLVGGGLWIYRKHPLSWITAGIFLSLLPLANVWRIASPEDMGFTIAERFLYLPSVLFCWAVAGLVVALPRMRKPAAIAMVVATAACMWIAGQRNVVWASDRSLFEATVIQSPTAPLLHARLGVIYSLADEHDRAIASLSRARGLHLESSGGDDPGLLHDLALAYRRAGRPEDALALLPTDDGSPRSQIAIAENLRAMGRVEEAGRHSQRAYAAAPDSLEAALSAGMAKLEQGDHRGALSIFEGARLRHPGNAAVLLCLGDTHRALGHLEAALAAYREAVQVAPDLAAAHAGLGAALMLSGQQRAAQTHFERALSLDPELADARIALAGSVAEQGDLVRARELLRAAIASDPDNADARFNLALVMYRGGDRDQARVQLVELLRAHQTHGPALSLLARLQEEGHGP